jgi:carboxypeptidase Q
MFSNRRRLLQMPAALAGLHFTRRAQPQPANNLTQAYQSVAGSLIGAAMVDTEGMARLQYLCDHIGHRLAGSDTLQRAIHWAAETLRQDGLANVSTPPVTVPAWVRGAESLTQLIPEERPLPMLGLGGSIGTPPQGIEADAIVVPDFDALDNLGQEGISGRIVVYNVPWAGYGNTVRYRTTGASRAAEFGAVAAIVRSVTPVSLQTPHTGAMRYVVDAPRIPAAAITVEDAQRLARLHANRVRLRLRLYMEARTEDDRQSANVIAEIPGSQSPKEVVVMGGHIDSWDVGQGAHDDGAGCLAAMQALTLIHRMGLKPRRTLRVCLWTNEENGLRGGNAYRAWSEQRGERHVAAIEMDGGAERPLGFGLGLRGSGSGSNEQGSLTTALDRLRPIGALLAGIHASEIFSGGGGADIGPLMNAGVPGMGLRTVGEKYFHWHHTHADTFDKVNVQHFRACMAALAVMGYVLADMPGTLLDPEPAQSA